MGVRDAKILLIIAAGITGFWGGISTVVGAYSGGIGVTGFACLLGIFARLAQAEQHHREMKTLGKPSDPSQTAR